MNSASATLLARPKFGDGPGLHRMAALTAALRASDWWQHLDALKVTGSNGKGSVARMLEAIFGALNLPIGLYTSPHIWRFNERIRVDGSDIDDGALDRAAGRALADIADYEAQWPGDAVGAFEAFTLTGVHAFADAGLSSIVAEAGIGGRLDSIRALPGRVVALTSIDLEHTELLGPTALAIALDKADLVPDGGVLVVGLLEAELVRRLAGYLAVRGVRVVSVAAHASASAPRYRDGTMRADLAVWGQEWPDQPLALIGAHQCENALLAILAARVWLQERALWPGDLAFHAAVARALAAVENPGRLQRVGVDPPIYVDVAHTPDAARRVAEFVRAALGDRPLVLLTGGSANKDIAGMALHLMPLADSIFATSAHHRGAPVARVAELARLCAPDTPLLVEPDIVAAAEMARAAAKAVGGRVLVAGGLFLAIEAAAALRGDDPRGLQFL
jgi:dihydrofolate synthase / folylpolyglutamate synthase